MTLAQRMATGLAIGAAALALPFAASPAYAADWELAGGFGEFDRCIIEGYSYIVDEGDQHDFTEFECVENDGGWQVWVR